MAEPETSTRSVRRAARALKRDRFRKVASSVGAFVVVLAAVATALVLTNIVTVPGADSSRVNAASVRSPGSSTTSRPARASRHRALTPDAPLRLWIAGDSLAGSIGPSLGQLTANTGVVQPQYDSRVSSGLLNPNFFDWPKHVEEQLALLDPEVVVFIIGTNDANVWAPRLADEYRSRTETMMRALVGPGHREVYWVGAPVAQAKSLETGVVNVDLIQRAAAAHIPGVNYVDAHAIFDDDQGHYQRSFPDATGVTKVMRADDGVHFSVAGADLIGADIFALLDRRWDLTRQTVPGAAKQVIETKGSTQVPGTHRSVDSSVSDGAPTSRPSNGDTTTSSTSTSSTTSSSTTPTTSSTTTTTATSSPVPPST